VFNYDHWHAAISALREKQVFFIGGSIKSGTTWLQLLLNAHPEVSANGEGHFLDLLAPALKMAVDAHGKLITEKNESIFSEIRGYPRLTDNEILYVTACTMATFLIKQSNHKVIRAVGEKSPDNVLHFPTLQLLFPAAKFIHIIRDGRDCAVSAWFHNLRVQPHWAMSEFGSVEAFACKFADQWAAQLATAQSFADRHPHDVCQVQYEALSTNTEPVLSGLFLFLGVPTSDAITAHCLTEASFVKLSRGRNPGEEDRRSFFRKGMPGDWRNHLGAATNARFLKQAGPWLRRFGYA
jgi:Sulfotransferase family